jgi:uncharacterized protein (TIGR04255 family)
MPTISSLPSFKKPPIVELALGVQFDTLPNLKSSHFGAWWSNLRKEFPRIEEYPPLPEVVETFDASISIPKSFELRLVSHNPVRYWFLKDSGRELIQIQANRLIVNWRKINDNDSYPRFHSVRDLFSKTLASFCDFLDENNLGPLIPNQCEVTYVNHIRHGEGWKTHDQFGDVFAFYSGIMSDSHLKSPEAINTNMTFIFSDESQKPIGRFHVDIASQYRIDDKSPIFAMNLTARGAPISKDIKGVLQFLELGHERGVRGFTSLTTAKMHKIWEREY